MTIPWNTERANAIIAAHANGEGALLPLLHALNHEFGCVPAEAVKLIASALNLTRAEVHGVISFYHDFRREPAGRHTLKLCRAEACQAAGGDAIAAHAEQKLGIPIGDTTKDGVTTLEATYCLGLCAVGPSAMLDARLVARLDDKNIDRLIAEARA